MGSTPPFLVFEILPLKSWGPWDWIAWTTLGLSALGLALEQLVASSPNLRTSIPKALLSSYWSYIPAVLFSLSALVFIMKETRTFITKDEGQRPDRLIEGLQIAKRASLKLQFFGDERVPLQISQQNVVNWFAYFSPRIQVIQADVNGQAIPGGTFETPMTWVIFLTFDKPVTYRQAIVNYANENGAPITEVRFFTDRSLVVTTRGPIPSTVMNIQTEQ